jgi:hypothetical protein
MTNSGFPKVFVAAFAIALLTSNCSAAQVASITPGPAHPVARAFFGANIDGAYNRTGTYQWTDPATIAAVKTLGIESLRYPGGTDANYFDWHTGWVYSNFPTGAGPFKETLENFAPLAQLTGPPVFDLNVMTYNNAIATPTQAGALLQDQIAMLRTAQQMGMPVEYIELGNELYFALRPTDKDGGYYAQRFASGAAYINEMNYWIRELKSAFPQAQVAVLGQAFQGGNWNADVLSNISGADAVTLHYYQNENTGGEDPTSILSKAFTKWANFRATQIEHVAARRMSVWVTEFDFIDHSPNQEYASTWLHGLFDAEMLIQFLSEPAITTVDIYNFHSQSRRSSLIYDGMENFGQHGAIRTQAGAFSASGQVVSLFGQALKGTSAAAPISVSGLPPISTAPTGARFTPFPAVSGVSLSYGATGDTGLFIVNLSPQSNTLSFGDGTAQIKSIYAPSLSTNIVTASSLTDSTRQISLSQFELPPFSVNYIRK